GPTMAAGKCGESATYTCIIATSRAAEAVSAAISPAHNGASISGETLVGGMTGLQVRGHSTVSYHLWHYTTSQGVSHGCPPTGSGSAESAAPRLDTADARAAPARAGASQARHERDTGRAQCAYPLCLLSADRPRVTHQHAGGRHDSRSTEVAGRLQQA